MPRGIYSRKKKSNAAEVPVEKVAKVLKDLKKSEQVAKGKYAKSGDKFYDNLAKLCVAAARLVS